MVTRVKFLNRSQGENELLSLGQNHGSMTIVDKLTNLFLYSCCAEAFPFQPFLDYILRIHSNTLSVSPSEQQNQFFLLSQSCQKAFTEIEKEREGKKKDYHLSYPYKNCREESSPRDTERLIPFWTRLNFNVHVFSYAKI